MNFWKSLGEGQGGGLRRSFLIQKIILQNVLLYLMCKVNVSPKNPQYNFPKSEGGEVKGSLELFLKFIRFGSLMPSKTGDFLDKF